MNKHIGSTFESFLDEMGIRESVERAAREELVFICDRERHLICLPYSIANLHRMAEALGIKRCWFHNSPGHAHYDIPKRRIAEITARCRVVTSRELLALMKG